MTSPCFIRVLYFAGVRDLCGLSLESLEIPQHVRTVGDLEAELVRRHPSLAGHLEHCRFARNEEFCDRSQALSEGDVIAIIPPVSGGSR